MLVRKCPMCLGQGIELKPPYLEDDEILDLDNIARTCQTCNGDGILKEYDGNEIEINYVVKKLDYPLMAIIHTTDTAIVEDNNA